MATSIRNADGVLIVKPSGRIIGPAGGELRQTLNQELEKISGAPKVLFDFADVPMMDSSGLGTLMATHVSISRRGGRTGVINLGKNINSLIVMARLMTVFERFDNEGEAIAGLKSDK